jgi:hypothetical protein
MTFSLGQLLAKTLKWTRGPDKDTSVGVAAAATYAIYEFLGKHSNQHTDDVRHRGSLRLKQGIARQRDLHAFR